MVRMCVIEHVSNQEICRRAGVGNRIPLQLGSRGRVILAFLSEGLQVQVLNLLPEEERKVLQHQLEVIVNTHYSINEKSRRM